MSIKDIEIGVCAAIGLASNASSATGPGFEEMVVELRKVLDHDLAATREHCNNYVRCTATETQALVHSLLFGAISTKGKMCKVSDTISIPVWMYISTVARLGFIKHVVSTALTYPVSHANQLMVEILESFFSAGQESMTSAAYKIISDWLLSVGENRSTTTIAILDIFKSYASSPSKTMEKYRIIDALGVAFQRTVKHLDSHLISSTSSKPRSLSMALASTFAYLVLECWSSICGWHSEKVLFSSESWNHIAYIAHAIVKDVQGNPAVKQQLQADVNFQILVAAAIEASSEASRSTIVTGNASNDERLEFPDKDCELHLYANASTFEFEDKTCIWNPSWRKWFKDNLWMFQAPSNIFNCCRVLHEVSSANQSVGTGNKYFADFHSDIASCILRYCVKLPEIVQRELRSWCFAHMIPSKEEPRELHSIFALDGNLNTKAEVTAFLNKTASTESWNQYFSTLALVDPVNGLIYLIEKSIENPDLQRPIYNELLRLSDWPRRRDVSRAGYTLIQHTLQGIVYGSMCTNRDNVENLLSLLRILMTSTTCKESVSILQPLELVLCCVCWYLFDSPESETVCSITIPIFSMCIHHDRDLRWIDRANPLEIVDALCTMTSQPSCSSSQEFENVLEKMIQTVVSRSCGTDASASWFDKMCAKHHWSILARLHPFFRVHERSVSTGKEIPYSNELISFRTLNFSSASSKFQIVAISHWLRLCQVSFDAAAQFLTQCIRHSFSTELQAIYMMVLASMVVHSSESQCGRLLSQTLGLVMLQSDAEVYKPCFNLKICVEILHVDSGACCEELTVGDVPQSKLSKLFLLCRLILMVRLKMQVIDFEVAAQKIFPVLRNCVQICLLETESIKVYAWLFVHLCGLFRLTSSVPADGEVITSDSKSIPGKFAKYDQQLIILILESLKQALAASFLGSLPRSIRSSYVASLLHTSTVLPKCHEREAIQKQIVLCYDKMRKNPPND